jgi:DNA invertase Pin-like site-specific DNA recombinase
MPTQMMPPALKKMPQPKGTALAYFFSTFTSKKKGDHAIWQRQAILSKAEALNIKLIAEFADFGPENKHTGFQKMIDHLKRNKVSYVIATNEERFGNAEQYSDCLAAIIKTGTVLVLVDEIKNRVE